MKKNLLSLLCLLAFALPGLAEETSITVLPSNFGEQGSYLNTETSATIDGVEFGVMQINPKSGQIKKGEFYLYNKTAMPGDITKVVINEKSGSFTPSTTYLNLGDEAISGKKTSGDITGTEATAADGSKAVTLAASGNHKYFNLSGNIVTGTSCATSIVIYYNGGTSSIPTTCAAPVFNIENNSQVTVGTVVKATCNTPNSTVTISGLASDIVGEENAGYAEFEVTDNDLNKIFVLTAYATIVDENGEIIKSDNTTVQFEVIEAPNTISDELTTTSLGISGSSYKLYNYTTENTGVSYSAKAGLDQQAIHINTTNKKNGRNSGLTSVDNPNGLVIESVVVTVVGGTPIMNMSNTPGVVEGTTESAAADISVSAPADAETITGTQSGSDMVYKPTKEFKYFTLTSDGNSHFSKVLVNYFKPEVPEVVEPEAIVVTPALSETNEITVTEGSTVTFSSNNAAQLSVSINAEAATLEANPYVLTVTEDCTVEIIPVDSNGKLYENLKLEAYVYVEAAVEPSTKVKSTYTFDFTKSDYISTKEGAYSDPEDMLTIVSDGAGIFGGMLIEGNGDATKFEYAENQGWKYCTNVSGGSTYFIDLYNSSEIEYIITSIKFNFADDKIVDLVNEIEGNGTVANNEWTGNSTSSTVSFTTMEELLMNSIDVTFEHEPVKMPLLNKVAKQDSWFLTHEDADHTIFFKITNGQGEDVTAERTISGTTPDVPARSIKIDADHEGYTAYAEGSEFTIYDGDILSMYAQHPHGMVSEIDSRSYEQIMTGVESIYTEAEGEAIYFNMQGVQVEEPAEGIYIRVANGKATKIIK